jgi:hypothetical protein
LAATLKFWGPFDSVWVPAGALGIKSRVSLCLNKKAGWSQVTLAYPYLLSFRLFTQPPPIHSFIHPSYPSIHPSIHPLNHLPIHLFLSPPSYSSDYPFVLPSSLPPFSLFFLLIIQNYLLNLCILSAKPCDLQFPHM